MFDKVLVANRGEVAVRIFRALRELGVPSVAVYTDNDRGAPYLRRADEAVWLGPPRLVDGYLDAEAILRAARETGADALHPGYGFLSERADFARACAKAKVTFIGPTPEAMEKLGDKVSARALAIQTGVPVSPGSDGALASAAEAAETAARVGYPVMLKAAGGGGGIGMRVVGRAEEMEERFGQAAEQAKAAFGDGRLFLERFLERPRHLEVQVLGDNAGKLIHLGERECSIQRRHQKLIEEAPSPALDDEGRARLTEMAVRLAKAGGYTNAGTLEFLYDGKEFYFNEVNARLQVEHPVTELVTGVDLVHEQVRVAAGEELTLRQEDIRIRGHAIECRINAEDPLAGFQPSPGTVGRLALPSGQGVRVDTALAEGWTVPSAYDSLVAKVITWGPHRDGAVARMLGALDGLVVGGFPTNQALQRTVVADAAFRRGDLSTRFLEERKTVDALQASAAKAQEDARERAVVLAAALAMGARGGIGALHQHHSLPPRRAPGGR